MDFLEKTTSQDANCTWKDIFSINAPRTNDGKINIMISDEFYSIQFRITYRYWYKTYCVHTRCFYYVEQVALYTP